MPKDSGIDQLFLRAEQLAKDFSLFPSVDSSIQKHVQGLLDEDVVNKTIDELRELDVDEYIKRTVSPSEEKSRPGSRWILKRLDLQILREVEHGPLYACEALIDFGETRRRVGFLVQERGVNNGVWGPKDHLKAVEVVREFSQYSIPIVTMIDTPGADAGEEANKNNQAHSISHLIAEMANIDLPSVGIIVGNGYSGGAIPLASTNILLSVRDGVFNTIQPQGLASIARKYDLSWQECAKYVGVSAYELYRQGYIDGIIDYVPGEKGDKIENLKKAIISAVISVEKRVETFVDRNDYVFEHYRRSIRRYLKPSKSLLNMQEASALNLSQTPSSHLNIFGATTRYLRYLGLRRRIRSTTTLRYGRLSSLEVPKGDLKNRMQEERIAAFKHWLDNPLEIKYDDALMKTWKNFQTYKKELPEERGRIAKLFFGDPKRNFDLAVQDIALQVGFHLYNTWKTYAPTLLLSLIEYLSDPENTFPEDKQDLTVLDVCLHPDLREAFMGECRNILLFDILYNTIVKNLKKIAREANEFNVIASDSVRDLLEPSLNSAIQELASSSVTKTVSEEEVDRLRTDFALWLNSLINYSKRGKLLKSVEAWKKIEFPRVSEPLFAIITFFFERILPEYYESIQSDRRYEGKINIRNIGIKDFWNRLTIAYHDLQISDLLAMEKRANRVTAEMILQRFVRDFEEIGAEMMTDDPVNFPGFRISIEQALDKKVKPCGVIAGIGRFKAGNHRRRVGIVISNLSFQAGAFDMASAEKFCELLVQCAERRLPVVCFISSGGMQTKEGAGSLFSMAIVNDRITRFVRDNDLPVICFGFGDCTGGAQASFVTHPMVQTYYFSGTNMPFAGQIVVPSYLPATATLSNYLVTVTGAMQGLVKHPFYDQLDERFREIDPKIPVAKETVEDVFQRIMKGALESDAESEDFEEERPEDRELMTPVKKVLIHARGCTGGKLIKKAQEAGISVVLVQSDPDMNSVAADMLGENDLLVCIGGSTPDESYLNAMSVIRVAEREEVDSLHPGIGFLSENSQFADLCRVHHINFIGPSVAAMERMGNKSNAIHTARSLNVPVVPGSHGILTSPEAGAAVAEDIGYPVLIKAVHGGGGKGIQVVERKEDFHRLFMQISAEARSAFGNGDVYLEKYIVSLRHVEIQILRDRYGNTRVLGLRDCSVQRKNQKVVEESASTMLPENLKQDAYRHAAALADEIDYVGAGTVEFIFSLDENKLYFMEMNTRLQIEHPVTELVTDIDIVRAQYEISSGRSIADMVIKETGYAMEVRVNAETASLDSKGEISFIPTPGEVTECILPERDDIQLLTAIGKGKTVSPFYDSMVVQIICTGTDRTDTIDKLIDYLESVTIHGICTNIPLLLRILRDDTFRKGEYDTRYLPGLLGRMDIKALISEIEDAAGLVHSAIDADSLRIEGTDELKVMCPSSGVFYTQSSPGEPSFANEGDVVTTSQTLCLLEAMKNFTPFSLNHFNTAETELYPSDQEYEVVRVIPVNGQTINTGDLMFVIRPAVGDSEGKKEEPRQEEKKPKSNDEGIDEEA